METVISILVYLTAILFMVAFFVISLIVLYKIIKEELLGKKLTDSEDFIFKSESKANTSVTKMEKFLKNKF
jgi:hypothetical protein